MVDIIKEETNFSSNELELVKSNFEKYLSGLSSEDFLLFIDLLNTWIEKHPEELELVYQQFALAVINTKLFDLCGLAELKDIFFRGFKVNEIDNIRIFWGKNIPGGIGYFSKSIGIVNSFQMPNYLDILNSMAIKGEFSESIKTVIHEMIHAYYRHSLKDTTTIDILSTALVIPIILLLIFLLLSSTIPDYLLIISIFSILLYITRFLYKSRLEIFYNQFTEAQAYSTQVELTADERINPHRDVKIGINAVPDQLANEWLYFIEQLRLMGTSEKTIAQILSKVNISIFDVFAPISILQSPLPKLLPGSSEDDDSFIKEKRKIDIEIAYFESKIAALDAIKKLYNKAVPEIIPEG